MGTSAEFNSRKSAVSTNYCKGCPARLLVKSRFFTNNSIVSGLPTIRELVARQPTMQQSSHYWLAIAGV
jgi:hypothetical protein